MVWSWSRSVGGVEIGFGGWVLVWWWVVVLWFIDELCNVQFSGLWVVRAWVVGCCGSS